MLLDTFYDKVFESKIIGHLFNATDKETIKDKQFCFLSQFLGGPLRYNEKYGPPKMRVRHMPHKITPKGRDEWLKLMNDSIDTLDLAEDLKTALKGCFPRVANHMVNRQDD